MSMRRELIRQMESLGWVSEPTRGSHLRWRHPRVKQSVISAFSPSDYRGVKNCIAYAKRFMREEGVPV